MTGGAGKGVPVETGAGGVAETLAPLALRVGLGRLVQGSLLRLTAGASQQSWVFCTVADGLERAFVLRRMPEGTPLLDGAIGPEREAAAIIAAGDAGVPVPTIRHVLSPGDGLGRGFVSDRVEGETIPRKILRDAAFTALRPRLAAECGAMLARLHGTDITGLADLPYVPPRAKLERLRALYRRLGTRRPVFEAAFRWLEDHMPAYDPARPPALVHGDFRLGNLIVAPAGVSAVLDWEMAHIGDPVEDLGWLTVNSWRFGNRALAVGGFGREEDMLAAYVAAGGHPVAPGAIAFWRIFGSLNWGIGCLEMSLPAMEGALPSVERAMIGRRSSETEIDILDELLEQVA